MVGPLRAELVAEIVGEQFPHLRPAEVAYIGEGCDSTAFDVNGELVFRFPKRSEVERQLFIETDILPLLAEHSPVPIPAFSFHGVPSPLFPRRFVGYSRLAGVPAIGLNLTQSQFLQLAPVLGGFLSFLHSFPVSTAAQVGVPEYPAEALIAVERHEGYLFASTISCAPSLAGLRTDPRFDALLKRLGASRCQPVVSR